jgi:choline monooxygenase
MPKILAHAGLPPSAYVNPAIFEQERATLFRTAWQWVGLVESLQKTEGIVTSLAGLPIAIEGTFSDVRVSLVAGKRRKPIDGAVAEACGRFVFVRLSPDGMSLEEYLGEYVEVLKHCSEQFDELYDDTPFDWACNWKAAIESLLEGYHVAYVHAPPPPVENEAESQAAEAAAGSQVKSSSGSNLAAALPGGEASTYAGPHSYQRGFLGDTMRQEMKTVAKRLKLEPSARYTEYDQFTIFPNMIIGMAGGCLCFMHIFDPIAVDRTHMRNVYLLAKQADPAQQPVPLIKASLLAKWRDYNNTVIGEDRLASERRQIGMSHAIKPGFIGHIAEERVVHFHKQWRIAMDVLQTTKAA